MKNDYITLLRETAMRSKLSFPLSEQEEEWFEEGITPEFSIRLIDVLDDIRP